MTDTASIEAVWAWLCARIPGLAESPGLGCPPTAPADWDNFCEGRLTVLIARALGVDIGEIWFTDYNLSLLPGDSRLRVVVCCYVGFAGPGQTTVTGQGQCVCDWVDTSQFPSKAARLRAVAHALGQLEPQLEAEARVKAALAKQGITVEGTPTRRLP